jgi:hypothetical protein
MEITTKRHGAMQAKAPGLATCFEIVLYWSGSEGNIAQLARSCAAALCIVVDKPPLPAYKPAIHKPDNFGHIALGKLLETGETSETIFAEGTKALQFMSSLLPTDKEAEEAKDFLDTPLQDGSQG